MAIKFDKSSLWYLVGMVSLATFAWMLANVDIEFSGRSYAVYGGIYIVAAVVWLWIVDNKMPSQWDLIGTAIVLIGTAIIFLNAQSTLDRVDLRF